MGFFFEKVCGLNLKQILITVYSVDFEDHPFTQQQLPACKPILAPQIVSSFVFMFKLFLNMNV